MKKDYTAVDLWCAGEALKVIAEASGGGIAEQFERIKPELWRLLVDLERLTLPGEVLASFDSSRGLGNAWTAA